MILRHFLMQETHAENNANGAFALILGLFCLAILLSLPAKAQIEAKTSTELNALDATLELSEKELAQNKARRKQALSKIDTLEKQIADRSLRFEKTQHKLNTMDTQALALEVETAELKIQFSQVQSRLAIILESSYLMGQQSGLKVALSQRGTQHMARMNHYTRRLAAVRQHQMTSLQDLQMAIDDKSLIINAQRAQMNKLSTVLQEDQRYLTRLKQNRLAMIKDLNHVIDKGAHEIEQLYLRKARLEALLLQIVKRQNARKAQAKRTKHRATLTQKRRSKTPRQKDVVKAGSLPMPAKARIVARFGDKRSNSGLPWSGILLQAKEGTNIRAISAGEIVFADWLPGYGQLVILDHGNNLMSLYGHNKRIFKGVGDQVRQSDIIAAMGDTAGLQKAALYFEIRKNGKPQDPLKWCRI